MQYQIAKVAIDAPLVEVFDYLATPEVQVGALVNVPFGKRQLTGSWLMSLNKARSLWTS